jgi:hypothetical protein
MMRHLVVLTTIAWLAISAGHTAPSDWAPIKKFGLSPAMINEEDV